jgi:hypothetical protein
LKVETTKQACGFFSFHPSAFILSDRRVPPGEYGFASSDGNPGTNGAIFKTRGGAWNKHAIGHFASGASDTIKALSLRR